MTKTELIDAIADGAKITKTAAGKALDVYLQTLAKELKNNGKIGLVGFGTFSLINRKAREGRNPKTGDKIKIAARKVIKFKPGKALVQKVN